MTVRLAFALGFAALALGACRKESPIERVKEDFAGGGDAEAVKLDVSVAKTEVSLGDDVVFHFKLTNSGKSRATVNVPRLDLRSASLRVRREDGSVATVTRNHSDIDDRMGQFRPQPGETKELAPGESLEKDVSTVAVQVGKIAFTPAYSYQGSLSPLVAPTIDVTVVPSDPSKPRLGVTLETSLGDYTAVLRPDISYNTCESFASLVKKGFYAGVKFHRVIAGFMAQGGDPEGTGGGGPGYFIPFEGSHNPKLKHKRGVMSMARTGIARIGEDTAGSQFFILFATRTDLDQGGYTTFAEMVDGEQTLKKLESAPVGHDPRDPQGAPPLTPIVIQRASLVSVE